MPKHFRIPFRFVKPEPEVSEMRRAKVEEHRRTTMMPALPVHGGAAIFFDPHLPLCFVAGGSQAEEIILSSVNPVD